MIQSLETLIVCVMKCIHFMKLWLHSSEYIGQLVREVLFDCNSEYFLCFFRRLSDPEIFLELLSFCYLNDKIE